MRCAIVRAWTVLTTALFTAAVADACTEFAENLGWLGGSERDVSQQAIGPTLLIAAVVGTVLAGFVAFAKIAPQDKVLRCMDGWRARATDLGTALAGSALCAIAMEGYETRFGGLSPFDPRSVVMSHAFALLVAFVVVAVIARRIVGALLALASIAGELAGDALVEFLHRIARAHVPAAAVHRSAFTLVVLHPPPAIAYGACGLRAPPRSMLLASS
jgi:hypothetical protein